MSGLLERIVRRRRASASSRLGPPSLNGVSSDGLPSAHGGATAERAGSVNGAFGAEEVATLLPIAVWGPAPAAVGAVEAEPETTAEPEPEPATEPEASVEPDPEAELETFVEPATEPELETFADSEPDPEPPPELEPEATPGPEPGSVPGFVERGRMRRRARYLRRVREVQLRDIGGFVLELHRFGRTRADLVQAKVLGAAATDSELRALEQALGEQHRLRELREPGIGGACDRCGAVYGSGDRFCATCGVALTSRAGAPDDRVALDGAAE
jgi:hypothetical protein